MGLFLRSKQSRGPAGLEVVAAAHVDGDTTRIVVASFDPDDGTLTVTRCAEGRASDLPALIAETNAGLSTVNAGQGVRWVSLLTGGDALHEVQTVPPQVRSFDDTVRRDAVLAGSRWGNIAALATSGYSVGHAFSGDQCLLAIARTDALAGAGPSDRGCGLVSTDAFGLLALAERVRPDLLDASAGSALLVLCNATSVAFVATADGSVRLLHQTSLLDRLKAASPVQSGTGSPVAEPQEAEYEFSGSYTIPAASSGLQSPLEARSMEVETSHYQPALLHLVDEVLGLASESEPFSPDVLLVTGEAVHRHAVTGYLRTCFGTSVATDEFDVALSVRIGDLSLARELAAQQAQYAGALGAVALATSRLRPRFESIAEPVGPGGPGRGRTRSAAPAGSGPMRAAALLFVAAFLVVLGGIGGSRLYFESRRKAGLEAQLAVESHRRDELLTLADEWKSTEARLLHVRSLLEDITRHRLRQHTPPRLLETVRALLPADVRLTELSLAAGSVKVSGYCETHDLGPTVALAMEQRRDSFADVVPHTNTASMRLPGPETGELVDTPVHTFTVTARYVGGEEQ